VKSLLHTITEAESIDDESRQVLLLSRFLHALPDRDLLWIAFLLRGGKVRPLCTRVQVMEWAKRSLDFPAWLVDDSVSESGDLAEALAALFGGKGRSGMSVPELKHFLEEARLLSPEGRRKRIADVWCTLEREQRELFTRLILGGSIASLPARVVHRAVAEHFRVSEEVVALWFLKNRSEGGMRMTPFLRWSRAWQSNAYSFAPLDVFPGDAVAGDMNYWRVDRVAGHERVQLIKRYGEVYLWTQHRSCLNVDAALAAGLPDGTVLECGYTHGGPLCAYALLEYEFRRTVINHGAALCTPGTSCAEGIAAY
jgi:DNA ligase-1